MEANRPIVVYPELMNREQAARYLGTTAGTLAVWASTKRYPLPFVKIGSLVRYRKQDLDHFIEQRTMNQPEAQ